MKVAGLGSPIIDLMFQVDDAQLSANVAGEKGGMNKIDDAERRRLLAAMAEAGVIPAYAIGGSAFNTIAALANLGMPTRFIGKIGTDRDGEWFRCRYLEIGGDVSALKTTAESPTANCFCFVTRDSQRTMRSHLGASLLLRPDELDGNDLEGITHVHIEGFQFFMDGIVRRIAELAKACGATVSLDLASFEVVRRFRNEIEALLPFLDIIFANEDEAREFLALPAGTAFDPRQAAEAIARHTATAVVKGGADGAWIRRNEQSVHVDALPTTALDTTGAGDFWQAGFLYGILRGCSSETSGKMGALLASKVVAVLGAELPEHAWRELRREVCRMERG